MFLLPWATETSERQHWQYTEDLETQPPHYAGLRIVPWQEHLFLHCFGTFSISSVLFYFVLRENNLKIILTVLPEKWHMLVLSSRNTSLALNGPRIQSRADTKRNTETNTTAARGCRMYTCATENPELGIFRTGKQMNCKTCLEIITIITHKQKMLKI